MFILFDNWILFIFIFDIVAIVIFSLSKGLIKAVFSFIFAFLTSLFIVAVIIEGGTYQEIIIEIGFISIIEILLELIKRRKYEF